MPATSRSSTARTAGPSAETAGTATGSRLSVPVLAAAGVSAAALAGGALIGVVHEGPESGRPAFTSWPLLVVLAVAPAAAAWLLVVRGRSATAAGLLIGVAALAPGRAIVDAQFAVDASRAMRPEFLVPGSVSAEPAFGGLLLLLAGHAAAVVAGVLAARAAVALPDDAQGPDRGVRGLGVLAVGAALALAVGVLMPPYDSADANLLDGSALDGPALVVLGSLAIGLAAIGAVVTALTVPSWGRFTGVLAGVAVAGASLALPNLVGVAMQSWLSLAAGPILVVGAAVVLLAVPIAGSVGIAGTGAPHAETDSAPRDVGKSAGRNAYRVGSGPQWLYVLGGAFAVSAAVGAVVAARQPLVQTSAGGAAVLSDAQAVLIPAGIVLGVLGVGLLIPRLAEPVRPAVAVAWAGVVLAVGPALQLAVAAPDVLVDATAGPGAVYAALAAGAAALAGGCAAAAGVLERDGVPGVTSPAAERWLVLPAAALAVGAFVFPTAESADQYRGAALLHPVDVAFGGTLVAVAVAAGALILVPWSRAARAVGTLVGVLSVLLLRALEPLLVSAAAGVGVWLACGCAALVIVLLVLVVRRMHAESDR
ncbi:MULTISPECIES: hypothetical protein [Thermocrispum]|nr:MULTISPECIES: hypothetical protein [Thermocrispum]